MTDAGAPYLSVVAAARNDDHGGNFLRRLQTFINALLAQAGRHDIALELILVEWNPPPDRPKLAAAIRWPADFGPASVRIVEVPPELHRRYRHADALPLYQMIAKNAGIRRAKGQFILATNIDILFSEELLELVRERKLQPGRMYRVDRYDVGRDVPVEASIDERLAYCRTHLLRLNAREGTFRLTPEGLRQLADEDIAPADSGIFFGRGWFPAERRFGEVFRWAYDDAEIILRPAGRTARELILDLEPGPGVRYGRFGLQVLGPGQTVLAEVVVARRSLLRVPLPAGEGGRLRLHVLGGGVRTPHDPRVLNLRMFRCAWAGAIGSAPGFAGRVLRSGPAAWDFLRRAVRFWGTLRRAEGPLRVGLPLPPKLVEKLQLRAEAGGISFALHPIRLREWRRRSAAEVGLNVDPAPAAETPAGGVLHTSGCGDFTLMAREHWMELRGYPEFDLFSFNLDSVLCYAAHHGGAPEEFLDDPVRIYHIEHASGSGWTPEGDSRLFQRMAANGLSWIDQHELAVWADQMRRLRAPMIFNRSNWGLADFDLPEAHLPRT